jgi:hypothetical protein
MRRMEIPPIKIFFSTKRATDALTRLSQATLNRPELLQGIAKIQEPLFHSYAEGEGFSDTRTTDITVVLEPSETFRRFLKALDGLDSR